MLLNVIVVEGENDCSLKISRYILEVLSGFVYLCLCEFLCICKNGGCRKDVENCLVQERKAACVIIVIAKRKV